MKHTWTVPDEIGRLRLDVFLTEQLPETTRSHIAKLLKLGAGQVNSKKATVHEFLKPGDVVTFDEEVGSHAAHLARQPAESKERRTHVASKNAPPLELIDQTADWIVINKPAGLLVHPDREDSDEATLVDSLLKFDPAIAKVGEDPSRPGIMHRLDKEASGLMVIARTHDAFENLKKQFAEHSVEKRYLALVYGDVSEDHGDIKFRIARSKTKQRMAARPVHESAGKAAWTHFTTLKRFTNAALLELDIFSGRTHQIRAHLLAFGHPIMGDPLYNRKSEDRNVKAPRLMLQSVHLGFKDPKTGEKRSYGLPPAPEFNDLMSTF